MDSWFLVERRQIQKWYSSIFCINRITICKNRGKTALIQIRIFIRDFGMKRAVHFCLKTVFENAKNEIKYLISY